MLALLQALLATAQPAPDGQPDVLFAEKHRLELPTGDPRRLRLPLLKAGTLLELSVRSVADASTTSLEWVEVELLRDDRLPRDHRGGRSGPRTLQSVLRSGGPWDSPIEFRAPWDGNYVVVLRQSHPQAQVMKLEVEARLRRTSETRAEPVVLSDSTRRAVAVFSGGLLWTMLWLCGVPLMRAFRSRNRRATPPWYG